MKFSVSASTFTKMYELYVVGFCLIGIVLGAERWLGMLDAVLEPTVGLAYASVKGNPSATEYCTMCFHLGMQAALTVYVAAENEKFLQAMLPVRLLLALTILYRVFTGTASNGNVFWAAHEACVMGATMVLLKQEQARKLETTNLGEDEAISKNVAVGKDAAGSKIMEKEQ
jgi:hypothetical protein